MAFDFPAAPTAGQTYQGYTWDGEKWVGTTAGPASLPPLMDGIAAVGISVKYTREDHVHPSDTSRATVTYVDAGDAAAAAAANSKLPLAGGQMSGCLVTAPSGNFGTAASANSIQVVSTGGVSDAIMSFHKPGSYAVHFGLASDNNFYYGGWSLGGTVYRFWTTKDFAGAPVNNARLVHLGDYSHAAGVGLVEPYNGGIITGMSGYAGGANVARYRQLQLFTTSWWGVAIG